MIYLISGNGQGAGKTTLAEKLVGLDSVYSVAGSMRKELMRLYPGYDWENRTQVYKDTTLVPEYVIAGLKKAPTVREVLVDYGQQFSKEVPWYWGDKLAKHLYTLVGKSVVAIDDIRKVAELSIFKDIYRNVVHFHIHHDSAIQEPIFDNDALGKMADYRVFRD